HQNAGVVLGFVQRIIGILPFGPNVDQRPKSAFIRVQPRPLSRSAVLWLARLGAGVAVTTVTAHVLLVGVLGLYLLSAAITSDRRMNSASVMRSLLKQARIVGYFLIPIMIAGLCLLMYNQMRFGNPLDTGYHFDSGEGFTTPILDGLWGLILSPYRGVFWHTPLFILSAVAFVPFIRRHRHEGITIALLSVTLIGLYSMWWMWWGGFAWGPRFLVPLTPFWVLLIAPIVEPRQREGDRKDTPLRLIIVVIIALISFVVQLSSVLFNYVNYEIDLREMFPTDWLDPVAYGPPAQAMADFAVGPVFGQWALMRENALANLDLAWVWYTWQDSGIEGQPLLEAQVRWWVLISGVIAIGILLWMGIRWWRGCQSRALEIVATVCLPLVVIGVWGVEVRHNPHYGEPDVGYRTILAQICQEQSLVQSSEQNGAIVTIAPTAYSVAMNWLPTHCAQQLPIYGYATSSMDNAEAQMAMMHLTEKVQQLWFVTGGLAPHAPDNTVERWLADHAYQATSEWFEDYRLVRYATGANLSAEKIKHLSIVLGDDETEWVRLIQSNMPDTITPNRALPVDIMVELRQETTPDLRWFVQLLNEGGAPVAMLDTGPLDGYANFSQLPVAHPLTERAGLWVNGETPAGRYRVIAGLYNPANNNDRLRIKITENNVDNVQHQDFVELGWINVVDK
ncbi:MAG: hypothetical protein AAF639_20840, partial [Chloroflexota bacterium]